MKNKQRSYDILKWLSTHELISRSALCSMVGYDVSNFQHCFNGTRNIPEKYLNKFEKILKGYGY